MACNGCALPLPFFTSQKEVDGLLPIEVAQIHVICITKCVLFEKRNTFSSLTGLPFEAI
jgi:hypothetical protein